MFSLLNAGLEELLLLRRGVRRSKRIRLSRRFRGRIYWRDGGRCVYCDNAVKFVDATMDHVIPLVHRGRSRSKENIVLSCKRCNDRKGPLVPEILDDISPEQLRLKFKKITEDAANRKPECRPEWF